MAIKRPDIYEHNNPNYAIADSDFVKGGFRTAVADLTALYALEPKIDQLKEHSTIVYVSGETKYYILVDIANVGNINGWNEFETGSSGTGTITGGTNGLSTSGANIVLGGTLLSGTTINANNNDLSITNINDFQVKTSGDTTVLGVDNDGFLFTFTGGSVSFDDGGGLKYNTDYSSGYTAQSIPDVNYVTGTTSQHLKLDQTSRQHVTGSQPIFDEGINIGSNPTESQISGHTKSKVYYDTEYETLTVNIGNTTKLQVGQEVLRYVYNNSANIIPNGSVVRDTGIHNGLGVDTITIDLAIASGITVSDVVGMATEEIQINSFGYIAVNGNINNLDTLNDSQYASISVGDRLYLSSTILGGVTNIPQVSPNINIGLGRLLTKSATFGKIFVDVHPTLSLNDLSDVNIPSPLVDNVLKWNGNAWVDASVGTTSASAGVNYYYATPIINSRTSPAGISQDGTVGNGIQIATLEKIPVTTGETLVIGGLDETGTPIRAFAAWSRNESIQRTVIDAGLWEFYDYLYVSSTTGSTFLIHTMYQVVDVSGSTISTSGATANSRTATITSGQFTGQYFNPSAYNLDASYLQTPSGIYQITASASTNQVTITVPTGYVNESGVTGSVWNMLFSGSTDSIENTTATGYQTKIIAPAFDINKTDKLGEMLFVDSDGAVTVTLLYNGTNAASFFITPLVTLHNDLGGLQGGTGTERYHLDLTQIGIVNNTSGINTGDETKSTIENKLIGTIITHTHPYSGLTGKPDLTQYQSVSGFTGYTATTEPIINAAITGATNIGTGTTIYNGSTGRNLNLNTFVGSGGTTIQKVGDEIVVNTLTISDNQQYSGETPSAIALGGIPLDYDLTGKTVSCILQDLLVPELCGTITKPSTSISLSRTGIFEIGCVLSQIITADFDRGNIDPQYDSISQYRSGAANGYYFTGSGMSPIIQLTPNANTSFSVLEGSTTWGVCTRYDAGNPALSNKGNEFCAALPSGCTLIDTASITGTYPWYWGTSSSPSVSGTEVAYGNKCVTVVNQSTPICFDANAEYLWFAAPDGTTPKTKWWVCSANAACMTGDDSIWQPVTSVGVISKDGCWTGRLFDVYVTRSVATTETGTPMCLYY
jgi:hypothetical protein